MVQTFSDKMSREVILTSSNLMAKVQMHDWDCFATQSDPAMPEEPCGVVLAMYSHQLASAR
jgi:hypothetical protein